MPDTVPPATSTAPAPEAAKTDAKQGASNLTASQMAQRFLKPQTSEPAPAEQTTPEATAPEAPQPSAAETEQTPASADAETNATEPAEKTDADGQDAKEEADDVLSHKSTLDPKTKERIQRRIDKEVGKRKQLEARLAEMESRLQQTPQPEPNAKPQVVPLPAGAPPLANIEKAEDLVSLQQQAKEAIRWAEEMLDHDGIENGVQVGDRVFSKGDLKTIIRQAKVTMEDHIPARYQFLQARHQAQQAAYTEFPFLKDKSSEEYQMAQAIYRDMPWLRNVPTADWIVGLGVEGFKSLQARKAAATKAKDTTKPKVEAQKPPASQAAVSAGSTVRAPADGERGTSVAYEKLKAKGGVSGSEFAQFLAQKELARNSR